jgi:hypothetical protein
VTIRLVFQMTHVSTTIEDGTCQRPVWEGASHLAVLNSSTELLSALWTTSRSSAAPSPRSLLRIGAAASPDRRGRPTNGHLGAWARPDPWVHVESCLIATCKWRRGRHRRRRLGYAGSAVHRSGVAAGRGSRAGLTGWYSVGENEGQ